MSPRPEATLVFPKLDLEEPSTRSFDILNDFVRRHASEPPVQVYERAVSLTRAEYEALVELPPLSRERERPRPGPRRAAPTTDDPDAFQKVR